MNKQVSATDAKNNFGGLLEDVAALGRVEIIKHGRLVAVVLAPREIERGLRGAIDPAALPARDRTHMIPAQSARAATMTRVPRGFDEDPA